MKFRITALILLGAILLPIHIILFASIWTLIFTTALDLLTNYWEALMFPVAGLAWRVWVRRDKADIAGFMALVGRLK